MNRLSDMLSVSPGRVDFLSLMRAVEMSHPDRPRIGRSEVLAQEIVTLRQDPFLEYPDSNIDRIEVHPGKPIEVFVRFLGYFGPQGALPLATTAEALQWLTDRRDPAFARFADIFATRFLQLYYRAWAEPRPVVQIDRTDDDRFHGWLGALTGIGSPASRDADRVPDLTKLHFAGLLGSRVKSAARLRQVLRNMLRLDVDVEERVGMWLEFEPSDRSTLGGPRAALGQTLALGSRAHSINDKIRLTVHCDGLNEYRHFLPGGPAARVLGDFLRFYLGDTVDVDICLTLPSDALPAASLSGGAQLGWTSFIAPPAPAADTPGSRSVCAAFSTGALRRDAPDPTTAPPVATPKPRPDPAPAHTVIAPRPAPARTVVAPGPEDDDRARSQRTVIAEPPDGPGDDAAPPPAKDPAP